MADRSWSLDPAERRVLGYLETHARGREHPVAMPALAAICNMGTRQAQEVIHQLVARHEVAICSSSRRGANGYWIPACAADAAAGRADLLGRIAHLAARLRALDRAAERGFTRQLPLLGAAAGEERSNVQTFEGSAGIRRWKRLSPQS